jgi:hypothetical protein
MPAAVLLTSLALLGAVAGARAQPQSFNGHVWVVIKGWGSVRATEGAIGHPTARCADAPCRGTNFLLKGPRVVLTEKPYKGWKFIGWRGACKGKKTLKCMLDASHGRKDIFGGRGVHATARFIPVAAGLTRAHPIQLGTAANIGYGFVVRVNSTNANVQLGTPPPAGTEYFDANLTATNTGGRLSNLSLDFGFTAVGSHARYHTDDGTGCSNPGPQPPLDTLEPFDPGESRTGYVCWTIAPNDASSLELFFGSGTLAAPRTTWFALHEPGRPSPRARQASFRALTQPSLSSPDGGHAGALADCSLRRQRSGTSTLLPEA